MSKPRFANKWYGDKSPPVNELRQEIQHVHDNITAVEDRATDLEAEPESGSNANGSFIKHPDGTMECWAEVSDTVDLTTAAAGGFRNNGGTVTWTFPAEFVSAPTVTGSSTNVNAIFFLPSNETTTTADLIWWVGASTAAVSVAANVRAIGKWQ